MARAISTTGPSAATAAARTPAILGSWEDILLQGTVAGLVASAVSAMVVFVGDLLTGSPAFYTAALLGSSVFYGLEDPAALAIWAGPVLAYNGLHLVAFLLLGTLTAWLAARALRGPEFWYLGLTAFVFVGAHLLALIVTITAAVREAASWWLLGGATALAALALMGVIWRMQPALGAALHGDEDFDIGD